MSKKEEYIPQHKSARRLSLKGMKIHFVGAGGFGMCSLIRVSVQLGAFVTGNDRELNENMLELSREGIPVYVGHREENVKGADLVVYSLAVDKNVPELKYAEKQGIPNLSRGEFLGYLNLYFEKRVAVSGTHGKSTTVAMLESILSLAGLNPTVLSGAKLPCKSPTIIGDSEYMLYEACEYKDSFLHTYPTLSIITNIEMDHPDFFTDEKQLKASFVEFANLTEDKVIINLDCDLCREIYSEIKKEVVTFGGYEGAKYQYKLRGYKDDGFSFDIYTNNQLLSNFFLYSPAEYNVANANAAIAAALELGVDLNTVKRGILQFKGIPRRMEHIGFINGTPVIYDYAHHPTEIAKTVTAIKSYFQGTLTLVFKPHTYSRTKALWRDFINSLSLADRVIITDIYPAREKEMPGVTAGALADAIGEKAEYSKDEDVLELLKSTKGIIVLMGAGDFSFILSQVTNSP